MVSNLHITYVYICHIICPWLNVQNLDHHAAMGDSRATGRGMLSVPCLWRRPGQKSQRARTARHVLFVDTVLHCTIKHHQATDNFADFAIDIL